MQTESIAQNHTTNSYHVFNYVTITQDLHNTALNYR